MNITVIGATGMVGRRVTAEALARDHHVMAVSRNPAPLAQHTPGQVITLAADAADPPTLRTAMARAEAVVLSVRPAPGAEATLPDLTNAVLDAATETGTRLLVVGGAGPLHSPGRPERLLLDDPAYVPAPWRPIAAASLAQLRQCQAHPSADWTYLSPPAVLEPGLRTGRYRRGSSTVLTDSRGVSRISAEDLAVAVLDELEHRNGLRWFTVADQNLEG